jgi:hypothetical protein
LLKSPDLSADRVIRDVGAQSGDEGSVRSGAAIGFARIGGSDAAANELGLVLLVATV